MSDARHLCQQVAFQDDGAVSQLRGLFWRRHFAGGLRRGDLEGRDSGLNHCWEAEP